MPLPSKGLHLEDWQDTAASGKIYVKKLLLAPVARRVRGRYTDSSQMAETSALKCGHAIAGYLVLLRDT